MEFPDHCARSIALLRQMHPDFVGQEDPELLNLLISEIHRWFDFFIMNNFWKQLYRYIDYNTMKHREQRHHIEGVNACVYAHTRAYGSKYQEIIQLLAESHVYDDWGQMPQLDDYNVWFWKEKRGY